MAFTSELMPQEKKERLPFDVAVMPDGSRPTLWKWIVDKERDAYVVQVKKEGGGYEGTREYGHYMLHWKGASIAFGGWYVVSGDPIEGLLVSWTIDRISVPRELEGMRPDIEVLIKEALDAMGWLFSRERVRSVKVDFSSEKNQ